MRIGLLLLVLIATLFGSGFWYTHIDTSCAVPVHYRIGDIDSRFGTSDEEIIRIAHNAENVWESEPNQELFVYDPSASLPINLVFDERQENADIEAELREDLEVKEGMSESVGAQYEKLITEFRTLKRQYENRVGAYESSLKKYNNEVSDWNEKGGAPEAELVELRKTENSLKEEQIALEELAENLNAIVTELNRIGARGNNLIKDYNTIVEDYNERFSEGHEFTQGDYTREAINIYQFDSEEELTIVLAHEFGHALALGHVQNEQSVMYRTMETQTTEEGVTDEDIAELRRVCDEVSLLTKVLRFIGSLV